MLTQIRLKHFKCFESLQLSLSPLTILTGLNASGKSSVLQALTLLHQTLNENEWNPNLILNGGLISLGTARDVIDKLTGRNQFSIGVSTEIGEYTWEIEAEQRSEALAVPIKQIRVREAPHWTHHIVDFGDIISQAISIPISHSPSSSTTGDVGPTERIYQLIPEIGGVVSEHGQTITSLLSDLTYISADRISPRETYQATTPDQQASVGAHGEFTPWFLYHYANKQPVEQLQIADAPPTLLRQTEAWLRLFFPGASLHVEPIKGTNLMLMGIRTNDATDYHRPQNVGYGITHVLPILAACLGANRGEMILIENPESHLHPAGQAAIGRFLARAAAAGIQIILETHSDHVLNGIRRAVKESEQGIMAESISIHFFLPRGESDLQPQVISPLIDATGTLDHWPAGFFDQYDTDTSALINW